MDRSDIVFGMLIFLGIVIVIFLIFREFNCWYWKVNKSIELQEKTVSLLKELVNINKVENQNDNPSEGNKLQSGEKLSINDLYMKKIENKEN